MKEKLTADVESVRSIFLAMNLLELVFPFVLVHVAYSSQVLRPRGVPLSSE